MRMHLRMHLGMDERPTLGYLSSMDTVMLQFRHPGEPPTLDEVRRLFALLPDEIDSGFGVIATDPAASLYVVLVPTRVEARVRAVLATRPPDPAEALFANPKIDVFAPPQGGSSS